MRSFFAGFSSTFYLADSPAFDTSAFSPTGVVPHCCLFAGRSYLCVPRSRRQRLPQPRLCGSVLSAAARCASLSGSRRTSVANANIARLHALTARSDRSLTLFPPRRLRDAKPPVSLCPKIILFADLRVACEWVIFARYQDCRGILSFNRFGFVRAVTQESAFKPHS